MVRVHIYDSIIWCNLKGLEWTKYDEVLNLINIYFPPGYKIWQHFCKQRLSWGCTKCYSVSLFDVILISFLWTYFCYCFSLDNILYLLINIIESWSGDATYNLWFSVFKMSQSWSIFSTSQLVYYVHQASPNSSFWHLWRTINVAFMRQ